MTKKNHITSLRLPLETHKSVERMAVAWDTTPSFIYRIAVKQFVKSKTPTSRQSI